jgi:S-adenosylmethionine synthetase
MEEGAVYSISRVKDKKKDYWRAKGWRTAEYVSPGHPDKVCDQISDAILDEFLSQDPDSRVAVESMGGHGQVFVTGEVTSQGKVDVEAIVQKVYTDIGYKDKLQVHSNIVLQSPNIAAGVDNGGAGDQGIMIGYACDENPEMIPQELYLARQILRNLPAGFGPDAKSQVTLDPDGNIDTIVISAQHEKGADFEPLYELARKFSPKHIHINPTGEFAVGGFAADTGLTGRKLAVDNYGPQIPIGGGCYSGKDATKVDRSAAYMARRIAVDFLRKEKCHEVLVKLAYSIGVAEPVMAIAIINPNTVISSEVERSSVASRTINLLETKEYDLTPRGIIEFLDLKKPAFRQTAELGHFGNDHSWNN